MSLTAAPKAAELQSLNLEEENPWNSVKMFKYNPTYNNNFTMDN